MATRKIYLIPSGKETANAKFTAWVWGDGDQWAVFTGPNEDGKWSADIPAGSTRMIILRKSQDHANNTWDCWNRTGDVDIPTDKNCFE